MANTLKTVSLLIVCITLSCVSASICHASPKVQVDEAVYDAGTVYEGKDVAHEFILKNVGDQKLTFKAKPC